MVVSAWSSLDGYAERVKAGELTRRKAQTLAAAHIRRLRFGPDSKDYFWINDMNSRIVMHPYNPELVREAERLDRPLAWFALEGGTYVRQEPDAEGMLASKVFPGLRLDVRDPTFYGRLASSGAIGGGVSRHPAAPSASAPWRTRENPARAP